jgi:hypothetical protein
VSVPAADPAGDETRAVIGRLQARVAELEAELAAKERLNFELKAAAETSRNFRASVDAGHITLDLDNWGTS